MATAFAPKIRYNEGVMTNRKTIKPTCKTENGNIVLYLLMALFLAGVLMATMTDSSGRSADSVQIDELQAYLEAEIKTVESAINACVLTYSRTVDLDDDGDMDADDNPNPPFPVYGDLSHSGTGATLANILCPGAPTGSQMVFGTQPGRQLRLFDDTSLYTVKYYNDPTDGVMLKIIYDRGIPATQTHFYEAARRINEKLAACKAEIRSDGWAGTDADCEATVNKACLIYWIKAPVGNSNEEAGC